MSRQCLNIGLCVTQDSQVLRLKRIDWRAAGFPPRPVHEMGARLAKARGNDAHTVLRNTPQISDRETRKPFEP